MLPIRATAVHARDSACCSRSQNHSILSSLIMTLQRAVYTVHEIAGETQHA